MKAIFLLLALIFTLTVVAQDTAHISVTLQYSGALSNAQVSHLDTIMLNTTPQQTIRIWTNITPINSTIKLSDISVGRYWLKFRTAQCCVLPISVVVCSDCDNQFEYFPIPKTANGNCDFYSMVEINPSYSGGNTALAKDFQEKLNSKERKVISSAEDFNVHFFITKQKKLSDITFSANVPQEVRETVIKGLDALTNWKPAMVNGKLADDEFILTKKMLQ